MRVAMYYSNRDIRIEEMPAPAAGPGELLVRVHASGICGSDVMEWYRVGRGPMVLGHEIAGEIIAVGEGVAGYRTGDRISASHHVPCNTCPYCLSGHPTVCETLRRTHFHPGGFAEVLRLPAINVDRGVYRLPEEVSFEEATFIEPLACVLRGQQLAGVRPGDRVLVIGSGIAGLLHVQLARSLGAGRVIATDLSDFRLKAALDLGADAVIHAAEDVPAHLREVNDGRLADVVILCTGAAPAIAQGLRSVDRGGTVLFFAPTGPGETLPIPINDLFWRNEITLTSSYAGAPADHITALELIRGRRVRVREMITHRLGLSETVRGFQLVTEAKESIKVVIEPQR
ncbi:MAG: alcohol dehydrogenase catalytic domain-containing protein [Nitrospirae bacterium]|nr:alcohol dehydrogenase catalytic domain-containing protein [Nitrospirota bacterium]